MGVSYENPQAGKPAMFWGKFSRVFGYITASAGAVGSITNYIAPNIKGNSDVERIFKFLEDGRRPLLYIGGGLIAFGVISGLIGKIQHWWTNKNYYK